ncbi:MAG: zinc-ribbon domain-containing protein [Clostridia bacterium]|nr:zinc-ribbon domain-containing protein [Clostridia bacterium]
MGSHKKVWRKCSQGHVWEAFIYARAKENGTGCPVCDRKTKNNSNK